MHLLLDPKVVTQPSGSSPILRRIALNSEQNDPSLVNRRCLSEALAHVDTVSPLRKKLIIYFIGFTAALAGLLFGLDIGVISGALPFVKDTFKLSIEAEGTVVSALLWGAVIGTLISGMLSSHFGRRKTI